MSTNFTIEMTAEAFAKIAAASGANIIAIADSKTVAFAIETKAGGSTCQQIWLHDGDKTATVYVS